MKKSDLDKVLLDSIAPEEWIDNYHREYSEKDSALTKVFHAFPNNCSVSDVLIKVTLLNQFYHTQIYDKNLEEVAKHIVSIQNIDILLKQGDAEAVSKITKMPEGINDLHSFASKYCSFSNPEKYPIKDSITRAMLYVIGKTEEFRNLQQARGYDKLGDYKIDYADFKSIVDHLISIVYEKRHIKFSYKEIDEILWKYGKEKHISFN